MKALLIVPVMLCIFSLASLAQSVGIGTSAPDASAQLHIASASKGILIPCMTPDMVASIASPAKGLMIYDTITNRLLVNMGSKTSPNWRAISENTSWGLHGNSETNSANFIGTTHDAPLVFRIINKPSGIIDSVNRNTILGFRAGQSGFGYQNTVFGYKSLTTNILGGLNTAVGVSCLTANTSGSYNTALGGYTLTDNTVGSHNIAIGFQSMTFNQIGNNNTAVGNNTLTYNNNGSYNTALGYYSLTKNTTGTHNVAVGNTSLEDNTIGTNNVAVGSYALSANVGATFNVAIGDASLYHSTAGHYNTGVGSATLYNTTASNYNTALGYWAGVNNNLGWNNTMVGAQTNTGAQMFNCTALGQAATCTASSQIRIGNSAVTSIGGFANWSNISDGRFKRNVSENVPGLDFILKLRPVTYQLDIIALRETLHEPSDNLETSGMSDAIFEKEQAIQSGFIAQEVEQAAMQTGFDFSGIDKPKNAEDLYALRYAEFVVPLVKAIQEQQTQIDLLRMQLAESLEAIHALSKSSDK